MVRKLVLLSATVLLSSRVFASDRAWTWPAENLDTSVSPADDFYEYAVGGWRSAHAIPPDRDRWGTFDVLQQRNEERIREILEDAAAARAPEGSDLQKIGDFYASGMDTEAIEAAGITPIAPEIARIEGVTDLESLETEIAELHAMGVDAAFDFGPMPDPLESTRNIGVADEGGLGLPDRTYYFPEDEAGRGRLRRYGEHIARMLALSGETTEESRADAERVVSLETALAEGTMSRVQRRDPHAVYHPMGLEDLAELTPHFSWPRYFDLLGVHGIERLDVTSLGFFRALDRRLATSPIEDWRAYLRWHLLDATAPYLSTAFVDESFGWSAQLSGATEQAPRWRRVLHAKNTALGFAMGKLYVDRYFSADSKARVAEILDNIQNALAASLSTLSWMSPETRERALEKLHLMVDGVGYPDRWLDYSGLHIDWGSYVLNVLRASAFEVRRQLDKIGQPVDRGEWEMTPQTVNAYYNPALNEIVFPAGILQPPFFDAEAPAAWNYGAGRRGDRARDHARIRRSRRPVRRAREPGELVDRDGLCAVPGAHLVRHPAVLRVHGRRRDARQWPPRHRRGHGRFSAASSSPCGPSRPRRRGRPRRAGPSTGSRRTSSSSWGSPTSGPPTSAPRPSRSGP